MENTQTLQAATPANPYWSLRIRQFKAIVRLEMKKNFLGRRAILLYLIAAAPIFVVLMFTVKAGVTRDVAQAGDFGVIFANVYQALIVRTVVFFGCAWMFMNLFRGEMVDKSLHYYFLSPVRREVIVLGKYTSGMIASAVLFGLSTLISIVIITLTARYLAGGGAPAPVGFGHTISYVSITILGCFGYGACFLLVGLFFRNPIIPALLIYGWEWINFLLPPVLKRLSVIHYLNSLSPVPVNEGPLAVVGEPSSWIVCLLSIIIGSAVLLALAGKRIRRTEIRYAGE